MSGTLDTLKRNLIESRNVRSQNYLRVASAVKLAEVIVIAGLTFETCNGTTPSNAAFVPVDVSAAASLVAASGTLTSDATNVTDGDTCTIGATVYRFKDTLAAAYDVKIGADAATTLANLKKAINASGTAGTEYFAGTLIHPTVSAGAITSTTLVVTATTKGTVGNAIASTEASTHLSWGAATLASGADVSAADYTTALTATVNGALGAAKAHAVRLSANYVWFLNNDRDKLAFPVAVSETLTGTNNAWASATFYGGGWAGEEMPAMGLHSLTVNATEVLEGNVRFILPYTPTRWILQIWRAGALLHGWDGVVTSAAGVVTVSNAGSTDWQAADVITLMASA